MTWKEIEEELASKVNSDTIGKQIVYVSNNDIDCLPQISTVELKENKYPFVVSAPEQGMKKPKYDWLNVRWVDLSIQEQGNDILNLKEQLLSQVDEINNLKSKMQDASKAQSDILDLIGMSLPQSNEESK